MKTLLYMRVKEKLNHLDSRVNSLATSLYSLSASSFLREVVETRAPEPYTILPDRLLPIYSILCTL